MRSTGVRHAGARDFLSGDGAAAKGGRWNRRGIRAIYASTSPITAVHESYQNLIDYNFATQSIRPRIFCGADAKLHALLDLTDRRIRQLLGFTIADLVEEDWQVIQLEGDESWTQAIGRGTWRAGFEGLLAPSARHRPGGTNLVIFPDNLQADSKIDILGKEDLPGHPSWQ
jgi:RES domain-containing protein